MTHDEQHRMIVALMDFEHKMSRDDGEIFAMFVKRDKDDEDLDTLSQRRLETLHEKYVVTRRR